MIFSVSVYIALEVKFTTFNNIAHYVIYTDWFSVGCVKSTVTLVLHYLEWPLPLIIIIVSNVRNRFQALGVFCSYLLMPFRTMSLQVFVYRNDIFYLDSPSKSVVRLTDSGVEHKIFNGVPDWVYQGRLYVCWFLVLLLCVCSTLYTAQDCLRSRSNFIICKGHGPSLLPKIQ